MVRKEASLSRQLDQFLDHLHTDDDLAAVLRVHLYIEAGIVARIVQELKVPEALKVQDLRFPQKVGLGIALGGLRAEDRQPLLLLNSLRNKLAHELGRQIDQRDVDTIYNSFDEMAKALADGAVEETGIPRIDLRTLLLSLVMLLHDELSNELVEGWEELTEDNSN